MEALSDRFNKYPLATVKQKTIVNLILLEIYVFKDINLIPMYNSEVEDKLDVKNLQFE